MARASSVENDLRLILWIQALRAFVYGFGVVVLGAALARSGLSDAAVTLVFTAMLAGMALASIAVGTAGDRVGRRRLYALLLGLMGAVGVVFALSQSVWVLCLVALTGTMSTDANESGPITSLEQAMIGQASAESRLRVFGRYNAVAYLAGALGALTAGGPAFLHRVWAGAPQDQRWLLVFPLVAAACVALAMRLSVGMEAGRDRPDRPLGRSRPTVVRLSALFATDAFAGGFVVSSFIAFWFSRRFGASLELMSVVFFAGGLLQAGSSIVAAGVGARVGLLRTMVLSHLPSNLLLMAVPLMPAVGPAVACLLVRFALSQMDVPTRQAYIAGMVDPQERTAAAAFTNTSRYVARPFGQILAGPLMANVALGAPFVVAGTIKCGYDLVLWRTFRRVELPEAATPRPSG
ncbi:MAG: MFS transporter [Actinomycetota bacterium]